MNPCPTLPNTGGNSSLTLLVALTVIGVGVALIAVARRRQSLPPLLLLAVLAVAAIAVVAPAPAGATGDCPPTTTGAPATTLAPSTTTPGTTTVETTTVDTSIAEPATTVDTTVADVTTTIADTTTTEVQTFVDLAPSFVIVPEQFSCDVDSPLVIRVSNLGSAATTGPFTFTVETTPASQALVVLSAGAGSSPGVGVTISGPPSSDASLATITVDSVPAGGSVDVALAVRQHPNNFGDYAAFVAQIPAGAAGDSNEVNNAASVYNVEPADAGC